MRNFITLFFLLIFSVLNAQPTIYIVRHSEKVDDWPTTYHEFQPLSSEGIESAKQLAEFFSDIDLKAIFSSHTARTIHTAHATSLAKGIEITVNEACSDTSLISAFLEELNNNYNSEQSLLIVSHSNIIPYFLIKSGLLKDEYKEMDFTKQGDWWLTDFYGDVFIISSANKIKRINFSNKVNP